VSPVNHTVELLKNALSSKKQKSVYEIRERSGALLEQPALLELSWDPGDRDTRGSMSLKFEMAGAGFYAYSLRCRIVNPKQLDLGR
jgi:hypothetical protein